MNRYYILIASTIALTAGSGCNNTDEKVQSDKPNVIYILADDMGYGDVTCYNENSKISTPYIDKLASEGIRFTDAHTSSSVCTPTRYGIVTGRYSWRSTLKKGVLSGYSKAMIEPERLTVGKLMQENNYHTGFVGKWHLGWDWVVTGPEGWQSTPLGPGIDPEVNFSKPVKNGPLDRGFSYSYAISGSLDMPPYVYVENGKATTVPTDTTVSVDEKGYWRKGLTGSDFSHADVLPHLTRKSIQYINEWANSKSPFFLYFAMPAPHTPILPTSEFLGKSNTNFYGDFVSQVDHVVGQIIAAIEENGIKENTIVIFNSDNGCSPKANFDELEKVGHHPSYIFRGKKADIFEGGHRVPFIVSWPAKIKSGVTASELISTTDLMATLADILNYELPDSAAGDSYSYLPVLTGEKSNGQLREAMVQHSSNGRFAIRQGKWKLIVWPGSGGYGDKNFKDISAFQLYNMKDDPGEDNNVFAENPAIAENLKALLVSYIEFGRSTPGRPLSNEGMENWPQIEWMYH
ncbi:MAG: arylsulfatase [Bacteroidales bacterium]